MRQSVNVVVCDVKVEVEVRAKVWPVWFYKVTFDIIRNIDATKPRP